MSALADLRGFAPNRRAAPDFAPNLERLKSTRDAAGPLGLTLVPAEARGLDALEQAFATMIGERAQALTVRSDGGAVQLSSHSGRRSDRIEPVIRTVKPTRLTQSRCFSQVARPCDRLRSPSRRNPLPTRASPHPRWHGFRKKVAPASPRCWGFSWRTVSPRYVVRKI